MSQFQVLTNNPEYLDDTLRQLPGGGRVVPDSWNGTICTVTADDPGFVKYAIDNQGYGEVIPNKP